jgi:hypothetical protein
MLNDPDTGPRQMAGGQENLFSTSYGRMWKSMAKIEYKIR